MPIPLAAIAGGLAGGAVSQILPMGWVSNWADAFWNDLVATERLDEPTLVRLNLYGIMPDETYHEQMRKHGYTEARSDLIKLVNSTWMDPVTVIRSGWRESRSDSSIVDNLVDHGWVRTEAEGLLTAARHYPPPAELVRFQAKEVFEPAMVSKYGLTAELEGLDREAFYKAGMDDEQIENYWKAHWQHPAFTQVTEMLHRGQITADDVYSWFRLMEVPPYWRDKMTAISFNPYTRVDVRRMNKIGLIDEDGLDRAYMDLGYDEEKAAGMRDFTLAYNQQVGEDPDRDLTRSMLEKGYRLGVLSPSEFDDYLESLGYSEPNVAFIHMIVDQDISLDRAADWISILRNKVGAGLMTIAQAGIKLSALGFSDDAVRHYEVIFENYVQEPSKPPAKGDIKAWVKAAIVGDEEAVQNLRVLGYGDRAIYLFMQDWKGSEERYAEWIERMRDLALQLEG